MTITREQAQEQLKELYIFNANLEEQDVKKRRKKLYQNITAHYSNWERALAACGITKRKLRERERFILYCLLKRRFEQYGSEAVRPKNVNPIEIKERIVQSYKTIKALRDIVLQWNEDKVMYELHIALLNGANVEHLATEQPELATQMDVYFDGIQEAFIEYDKRFGLPSVLPPRQEEIKEDKEKDKEKDKEEDKEEDKENKKSEEEIKQKEEIKEKDEEHRLVSLLVKLGYIVDEQEAKAIIEGNDMKESEVMQALVQLFAEAHARGVKITEQKLRETNATLYFGIRLRYGTLEQAVHAMTRTLFDLS